MTRNLKALGLVVAGVLMLSAATAVSAQAEEFWLKSDGDWALVNGVGNVGGADEFKTDANQILKCNQVKYQGSIGVTTSTTLKLTPSFNECTFGSFTAEISTNGCSYLLHPNGVIAGFVHHTTGTIECETGKEVTIVAKQAGVTKCTIHIPPQNLGTGIALTNGTSGGIKDIQIDIGLSIIVYTETEGSGTGACKSTSGTANGSYSGSATLTATSTSLEPTNVWLEGDNSGEESEEEPGSGLFWFESDGFPTTIAGEGNAGGSTDELKTDAGQALKCSHITYASVMTGAARTTMALIPSYTGCTFGGFGATVQVKGCYFVLHTEVKTKAGPYDTNTTLQCAEGREVTVIASQVGVMKCTVHIPAQDLGTGFTLENGEKEGVDDIKISAEFSNIAYTETEGAGVGRCKSTSGTTNGTYKGSTTLLGENKEEGPTDLRLEGGDPEPVDFHSETEDTTLIGETAMAEEFIVNAGTAKCTESVYKGTIVSKSSSEMTVNPEYGSCTAFGFSAEVKLNGCAYIFHSGNKEEGKLEGSLDLECPEGKSMEIVAKVLGLTKCVVTIGAQSELTAITYTNEGSGATRDVRADIGATGVEYTQDTGEGLGKCSSGTFETGEYKGVATVIGENAKKEQVGIWVE